MNKYIIDWNEYAATARRAAAEGAVLLKNDEDVMPLIKGERVAVFGRSQLNYYKGGLGSGGLVNTRYVIGITDALLEEKDINLDRQVLDAYREWVEVHPFDRGNGWATEPWSQEEMPLTEDFVREAGERNDKAVIIIGRTAGEDRDLEGIEGSFLLGSLERDMLLKVCRNFRKVTVLLNVPGIIDMSWVGEFNPSAVMYVWQGGMEGGRAVADLLMGRINPSGHLTDTIAASLTDYPSTEYFAAENQVVYGEDIYVGYRYFETFNREAVLYPFGYGLSYTEFKYENMECSFENNKIYAGVKVTNIGEKAGKDLIQFYVKAPQGKLGRPLRSLIAYEKTKELTPGESQVINFEISDEILAAYDDSGLTGYRFSYLYEQGLYKLYLGSNVREAAYIGEFNIERDVIIKKCQSALAPSKAFKRIKPKPLGGGEYIEDYEDTPLRTYKPGISEREEDPWEYKYTGNIGFKLGDVYDRYISMGTFLGQLSDRDMRCLVRGEGMCSARVTPGTAAAFGGVTDALNDFGIPAVCCADGPSGIRMDCGTSAFALPCGTCLASSFNESLNEELYVWVGKELRKNRIDTLLGPGMNIHRNPLNGRNFEYFSEDPLVTGKIACAQLRGLASFGVAGTIKHFACNNKEKNRHSINSIVSERALREIYLKGFEIAVKEGCADYLMTSYGALNGVWCAGNYELNTMILRKEWGFEGMVMSDWWAGINEEGQKPDMNLLAQMALSGNDVYMVVPDALENETKDNLKEAMEEGRLKRGDLQKNAAAILKAVMKSPVMKRSLGRISAEEKEAMEKLDEEDLEVLNLTYMLLDERLELDGSGIDTSIGRSVLWGIEASTPGKYSVVISVRVDAMELAQVPLSFYANGIMHKTVMLRDTGGQYIDLRVDIGDFVNRYNSVKLYFGQGGSTIGKVRFERI